MDAHSPDLAQYWLAGQRTAVETRDDAPDRETTANESALAELADRIIAARTIM
jgi:hypothetical protein